MNLVIGLSILAACFCYFVVLERESKVKLMHSIAGTSSSIYWIATFVCDLINYLLFIVVVILLIYFLGDKAYNDTAGRIFGVLFILVMFALAVIPQMYTFSYLFQSPASATKWMLAFNIFTGNFNLLIL